MLLVYMEERIGVLFCLSWSCRWFHKSLTRNEAEEMLKRVHEDGAFLVRESETAHDAYAISFR